MNFLRIFCAAFWMGCGWCAGDAACLRTRRHLAALEQTLLLLERVRQEISFRHTDLGVLRRRLIQDGMLPESSGTEANSFDPPVGLNQLEKACFAECFSGIGRTEAEQECQRLALYQKRFTSFLEQARECARPQLELNRKLGIAAGLAAAILCL